MDNNKKLHKTSVNVVFKEYLCINGYEKSVKKYSVEYGKYFRSAKGYHKPHSCKLRHTANSLMKTTDINYSF